MKKKPSPAEIRMSASEAIRRRSGKQVRADKEQSRKANEISIQTMKTRKPYLYKEHWLTERYKNKSKCGTK